MTALFFARPIFLEKVLTKREIYDTISVQKERGIKMDFEVIFWVVALIGTALGILWMMNTANHESCVSHETIARIENGGRHL